MTTHRIPDDIHRLWSTAHRPTLDVASGDVVTFDAPEVGAGQYAAYENGTTPPMIDPDLTYPLLGPVMVDGAEPGDVVELEILDYVAGSWGWTAVVPGAGLLTDFPDFHVHKWDLTTPGGADFLNIATIPIRPFLGVMAATPASVEPLSVVPPGTFGGNLDCRDLIAGTRVFLPVQTPGARIALGDPHAAQGDGEVCIAAIEAPLSGSIRVVLHKDRRLAAPQFRTAGPLRPGIEDAGFHVTMGIAPDLLAAAQDATRYMIDHLGSEYGLDPVDAYVLCSVAVDLKITEVVDAPNWVVSAYLPLSIFTRPGFGVR